MDHSLIDTLAISDQIIAYILIPTLIFLALIAEVSINTMRIIYMPCDRRYASTILGFFEAFIWLIAIRQIFQHHDNWVCYLAYSAGFAAGIFVGIIFEEQIAYGKVIVRIISHRDVAPLISFLNKVEFRYTQLDAVGAKCQSCSPKWGLL